MTQGERVKEIRKTLGLTLDKFGEKVGVSKQTISRIENGINNVTEQMAKSICREYSVSEDWLRDGTGEMFAPGPDDELDSLAKRYDLTSADMLLVKKFMALDSGAREKVIQFMMDVTAALKAETSPYDEAPDTPEEMERLYPPVDVEPDSNRNVG